MSNPLLVTDKAPRYLLGVQRDVMNSARTVGGIDTDWWWLPVAAETYRISGGVRDGQALATNEYTSVVTPEGVTLTLNTPLTDGRVVFARSINGYGVTKVSDTVWRAERTVTLQVVGGVDDGAVCSWEERTNWMTAIDQWPTKSGVAISVSGESRVVSETGVGWHFARCTLPVQSSHILVSMELIASGPRRNFNISVRDRSGTTHAVYVDLLTGRVVSASPTVSHSLTALTVGHVLVAAFPLGAGPDEPRYEFVMQNATFSGSYPADPSCTIAISRWHAEEASASTLAFSPGRYIPTTNAPATQTDATLGPVAYDGSRTVTLAADTPGLTWTDAPAGWGIKKNSERSYTLLFTGDPGEVTEVPCDLDGTIGQFEQLELRGALTVYNNLTINGKLYITQELGF